MRQVFIALCLSFLCFASTVPARAAVNVSIGIDIPAYPRMVVVPGYPVYYAPTLATNLFFYDGMYWVYAGDTWYMSSWYNGPWVMLEPAFVPYYLLRVPARYYMAPPPYFANWPRSAPPAWGHHWGPQWARQHQGWDRWDRRSAPRPAPLPTYQRSYSGERYPAPAQQARLQTRNYRYQPRTAVARQHLQQQVERRTATAAQQRAPMDQQRQRERAAQLAPQHRQERPIRQDSRGSDAPRRDAGPRAQPQQMPPPRASAVMPVPQHQQQGRAEQQERGRGRGHGEEGKREDGGPRGR